MLMFLRCNPPKSRPSPPNSLECGGSTPLFRRTPPTQTPPIHPPRFSDRPPSSDIYVFSHQRTSAPEELFTGFFRSLLGHTAAVLSARPQFQLNRKQGPNKWALSDPFPCPPRCRWLCLFLPCRCSGRFPKRAPLPLPWSVTFAVAFVRCPCRCRCSGRASVPALFPAVEATPFRASSSSYPRFALARRAQ